MLELGPIPAFYDGVFSFVYIELATLNVNSFILSLEELSFFSYLHSIFIYVL